MLFKLTCYLLYTLVTIHTDLKEYNHLMQSKDDYIAGPVPELVIEGGETQFQKPVQVIIPHCVTPGWTQTIRVLRGSGTLFEVNVLSLYIMLCVGFVFW